MNLFSLNFKDAASTHMESLLSFHKKIKNLLLFISMLVLGGLVYSWTNLNLHSKLLEYITMEVVWTVIPAIALVFIGFPSLAILYQEFPDYLSSWTNSIFGHQWYWSHSKNFKEKDMFLETSETFRCLEVDAPMIFPLMKAVRLVVSSADVIHSFALPAFAVKVDAVPGRLKEAFIFPMQMGKFFGQCSEICGANHSFMPMSVEVLPFNK